MAPWHAVALGEIDEVVQRLHAARDEPHAWWEEWTARRRAHRARWPMRPRRKARNATAGNYYLRAGNYYYTGERMVPPGEQEARHLSQEPALLARRSQAPLSEHRNRRCAVRRLGAAGLFHEIAAPRPGRAPTVVLFDGLDNCKEMSVLFAGVELAFRGFHTLAIDGPGQGEALRLRNLPSRYDYEVAGKAAYEYVAARPDVDPKRVAIMAYSAGGYYAPRAAAFEKRYAACVAWGPHYDYHAVWQKRWDAMQEGRKGRRDFAFPAAVGAGREGHGRRDGEAQEIHAGRRRRQRSRARC